MGPYRLRQTGGLADVVQDFDPVSRTGNGFVFKAPDSEEMLRAIGRALEIYYQRPDLWQDLLITAMQARDRHGHDFTWTTAANRYLTELFDVADSTEPGR